MEISTRANGTRERGMGMESSLREMEIILKATGSMISVKDKAPTSIVIRISFLSASGLTTNQRLECIPKLKMKMLTRDQRNHSSRTHMSFLKFLN